MAGPARSTGPRRRRTSRPCSGCTSTRRSATSTLASVLPSDIQSLIKRLSGRLAPSTVGVVHRILAAVFKAAVRDRRIMASPCEGTKLPKDTEDADRTAVGRGGAGAHRRDARPLPKSRYAGRRYRAPPGRSLRPRHRPDRLPAPPADRRPPADHPARPAALPRRAQDAGVHPDHPAARRRPGGARGPSATPGRPTRWSSPPSSGHPSGARRSPPGCGGQLSRRPASLPSATFHALRHFYASLLIRHGESVKTVQARLGHASAAETLDTYSHLWPDSDDRTRAAVDSVLRTAEDSLRTAGPPSGAKAQVRGGRRTSRPVRRVLSPGALRPPGGRPSI